MIIVLAGGLEVARLIPFGYLWASYIFGLGEMISILDFHFIRFSELPGVEFIFVP